MLKHWQVSDLVSRMPPKERENVFQTPLTHNKVKCAKPWSQDWLIAAGGYPVSVAQFL